MGILKSTSLEQIPYFFLQACLSYYYRLYKIPIPKLQQAVYYLRRTDIKGQINTRTMIFNNSFYPHCLAEWSRLSPDIGSSLSLSIFKSKLLKCIRPSPKLIYSIHNPEGPAILTQLRVGLSNYTFFFIRKKFIRK